ncbi:MAG: PepSY domain-containing protein [Sphingomonadales bacterium]|nr:MAG: PepSY domain-containing protein [Sphingomonadales bacterium]
MRKWHRWLSLFFAVIMIWVAVTGVLHYVGVWWPQGEPSAETIALQTPPEGWECPEGWRCRPPSGDDGGIRSMVGFFHHLHSGEEFGIVGEIVVMLSGFALLFFSLSGLWMYAQMWNERAARKAKRRWFWK